MTCKDTTPLLSEYLDGTLAADVRPKVAAHLASCAECRALFADLDHLHAAARSLGPITPPDHIWIEIAGRIRLEQGASGTTPAPAVEAPKRSDAWQWLGLAAALLLVTSAVYLVARPDAPPETPVVTAGGNASDTATVETVEDTLRRAEAEYERAIALLEKVVKEGNQTVSPDTLQTLQRNVTTIDSAIAESRAALTDNPASQPARTSLFEALANKVNLLQSTVVLMNEMRQGDAGGAAEAAAGLGKTKTS